MFCSEYLGKIDLLGPGYFLLWLKDCELEICMLLTEVNVPEAFVTPIKVTRVIGVGEGKKW